MAFGGNKMGDAYVEMHGDTAPLKRDMADAKATVETETAQMGAAAEKNVGGGFEAVGRKIEDSTKGVRKLSSAISATAGIITGMIGVVGLLVSAMKAAADEAERNFLNTQKMRFATEQYRKETELALGSLQGMTPEQQSLLQLQIESAAKQKEIADLIRDGTLDAGEGYNIMQGQLGVLGLQHKARLEAIEAQREQLALLKQQADEAERLADAIERAKVGNEQLLKIQREMAGEFLPEIFGPTREDMERLSEAGNKAGEAFAKAMSDAFQKAVSGSAFNQNIAGPIEELGRRIETKLDALKFGGRL